MFIIASEQTRELDRLQKYLDKLGQPYRVFVTNLETDLDQQTESLATFFTQKDPASKIGKPLFSNDLAGSRIMGMLDTGDHNLSF
ncbi:MAG: hypothetical protein ACLT8H_08130 [Streptococcus parasanguinis]